MAQTIYTGGDIITMEHELNPQAVLVQDGIIKKIGQKGEMLQCADKDAQWVDLRGATLLPAFIDAHSHITAYSKTLGSVQLQGVKSFDEIAERMKQFLKNNEITEGQWISGFGYDHNFLKEKAHPEKSILDSASPDIPMIITHQSGHMGVVNSAGLKLLGIDETTKNPNGGIIGRVGNTNQPNGYLEETAFFVFAQQIPQPTLKQLCNQMERAQSDYANYGITTVQDGLTRHNEWELLEFMAKEKRLTLDIVSFIDLNLNRQLFMEHKDNYKTYNERLKIGGVKIFLDGSPQGKTAWMSSPYQGEQDYVGYPIYQNTQVKEFMEFALAQDVQILAHCNGDAAAQQMIDAYQDAYKAASQKKNIRPVVIHAQLVRLDQLRRMASLGMYASFFIAHTYYWGDIHAKNFGHRAYFISPAKAAIAAGVVETFHQDTPVLPPDMLNTIWCAVNRISKNGVTMGHDQCITPYEALKAVTINAAKQYFEEDCKGSIKAGKLADLVILDKNPLKVDPMKIKDIKVLQTIKEGKTVFHA